MNGEKRYTTAIFDLDGTLLNTLEDLTGSVNYALKKYDYPQRSLSEVRRFVGNGVRLLMSRALPGGEENPQFAEAFGAFKEHYEEHCKDQTGPYEGIMELLSALKKQGIPMAIVSNKIDSAVKDLNREFFAEYIQVAIGESAAVKRKPAPDTALTAMRELGVSTEGTVYIGDSDVDIQTAENAGLDCISVTWGFRDRPFLVEHGASMFVDHPMELLSLFERGRIL